MTEAPIRTERIIDIAEYIEECLDVLSSKQSVGLDTYLDDRNCEISSNDGSRR